MATLDPGVRLCPCIARRATGFTPRLRAARKGLSGHIRRAAIPTTLAMVPHITAPFQEKHPDVTFSICAVLPQALMTSMLMLARVRFNGYSGFLA